MSETYTPKPGTKRVKLLNHCRKIPGEFRACDLMAWAERRLEWNSGVVHQELRALTQKGLLRRIETGLYEVSTNGKAPARRAPAPVKKIAERVAKRDELETKGDRFAAISGALQLVTEALTPLSPHERIGILAAYQGAMPGCTGGCPAHCGGKS